MTQVKCLHFDTFTLCHYNNNINTENKILQIIKNTTTIALNKIIKKNIYLHSKLFSYFSSIKKQNKRRKKCFNAAPIAFHFTTLLRFLCSSVCFSFANSRHKLELLTKEFGGNFI